MLDDDFHGKMLSTQLANQHAAPRLNAAKMRAHLQYWLAPVGGFPKVHAILRIVQRAFDGQLTAAEALKEMAQFTGEYQALKLSLEKARQASRQYDRSRFNPDSSRR